MFFLPKSSLLHSQTLFAIPPSIPAPTQTSSKAKRLHGLRENPYKICCFSHKHSSFEPGFGTIDMQVSPENPDSNFSDSARECVGSDVIAAWLQSCRNVKEVKRVHAMVLKSFENQVIYVGNNLISSYLRLGKLVEARKVFDEMSRRNVVSWTAMIHGYLGFGYEDEALVLFHAFIETGIQANEKMFVCVMNLCSRRVDCKELGRQVHAHLVKRNLRNLIVDSAVVHFYAESNDMSSAFCAFDRMPERDVVCWTTMIASCSRLGHKGEVFSLFSKMLNDGYSPNEFTLCSILKACGENRALRLGRQLHGVIAKKMIKSDVFVGTSLIDMYAKCGEISDSRRVFNSMNERNTVTWTSIIAAYARKELGEEAIDLFRVMKRRNVIANNLTIVSILRACGSMGALFSGKEVHAQIIKNCIQNNIYIGSTLVWLYCKCGQYPNAFNVLQQMPFRDVVSWTAMISGCSGLGHESEALEFMKEMIKDGVEPNPFTYSSAISACANSEAILLGKSIHSVAKKNPAIANVFVGSALIHMYAKCGFVSEAYSVFDSMPERNSVSWKTMILGYARNGMWEEALKLMHRMQAEGFTVDDYIFTTVLSCCGDVEWDVVASKNCRSNSR